MTGEIIAVAILGTFFVVFIIIRNNRFSNMLKNMSNEELQKLLTELYKKQRNFNSTETNSKINKVNGEIHLRGTKR